VTAELVRRARAVMANAYAPYSHFPVGAAVQAEDGSIHVGTNVENASYGLTICAERMAVGAAIAAGQRRLVRVAVASQVDPPATPCGACRQLLAEFGLDMEIIAVGPKSERRFALRALLPEAFTRDSLAS
jgi:cytidine deaminase